MNDDSHILSSAGRARREEILHIAKRAARRKRQARSLGRGAALCVVAVIAVSIALRWTHQPDSSTVAVRTESVSPPVAAATPAPLTLRGSHEIVIRKIATDSHIVSRLNARHGDISIERLSDDRLLDELAMAHQPAGLIHMGSRAILLPRR